MRPNKVIEAWQAGETAFAAWTNTESSYIAEVLGHTGADAVVIDMQHGMADMHSALSMLQAISATPATPFVRVPGLDPRLIMKLLDYGSYGLICPLVDNAEQAEAFVVASSYPPRGGAQLWAGARPALWRAGLSGCGRPDNRAPCHDRNRRRAG